MPKSTPVASSDAPSMSHREERMEFLTSQVEELETSDTTDNSAQIAELTAEVDRLEEMTDEQFDEEIAEETGEGGVEVITTTSSPQGAPALTDATGTPPVTPEIDPETGKPFSAYKARLRKLNRDALGAEIPLELADMMRAAAKKAGDIALTAWVRLAWADAVNNANLEHEVTSPEGVVTTEAWVFDKKRLDITVARSSTRGLTPEEKEKKENEKKAAAVDQRSLVKFLLVEHKVKTGVPLNAAEVEVLKANNREDLLSTAKLVG